jgi:tetratricopeptide (TPR) repeat protein
MTTDPICKATTKRGAPCKNLALPGLEYCAAHQHLAVVQNQTIPTNPWARLLAWWYTVKQRYWMLAALLTFVAAVFAFVQLYNAFTGRPFQEVIQSPPPTIPLLWIISLWCLLGIAGTAVSVVLAFRSETADTTRIGIQRRLDRKNYTPNSLRSTDNRRWRYHRNRPYALLALVLIPLLTIGGALYGYNIQQNQVSKFIVLVADFDGPDPQTHRVTEIILAKLRAATRPYERVEVLGLGETIAEAEGTTRARSIGEAHNADIVIWGWYGAGKDVVPLSVHFERLCQLRCIPRISSNLEGSVQVISAPEFADLTLQTNLSGELSAVSLLVIGLARLSEGDWDGAITSFSDALMQSDQGTPKREVYYYRALSYHAQHRCDLAVSDLDMALKIDPYYADAYNMLSTCFATINDLETAIALISKAIELDGDVSTYYFNRGAFHLLQAIMAEAAVDKAMSASSYTEAFRDIDEAIEMSPDEIMYLQQRAGFHYQHKDYDQALTDLNGCLELSKQAKIEDKKTMAEVYYLFGNITRTKGNHRQSLIEYTKAIEKDATNVRAYWGRGLAFLSLGDRPRSVLDLNQALNLAEDPGTREKILKVLQTITGK